MKVDEHLWGLVSEECHEIVKNASNIGQIAIKILRFGENPSSPDGKTVYDNVADLIREANDLQAVLELLQEHGLAMPLLGNRVEIQAKKEKIRLFMQHSENLGRLDKNG